MVLRKLSKITNNKPVLISTIFFTVMSISFFSLRFDLFSIIAKEVNQIRNNVVCVVARICFRALLCTQYGPLICLSIYFRKLKEIRVLRFIFPDELTWDDLVYVHSIHLDKNKIRIGTACAFPLKRECS